MSTELALASSVQPNEWPMIEKMGSVLSKSGLATSTRTAEQAIVKIWFGRELGLSAVMSVQDIHFIEGKPSVGINIMQALLARGGVTWEAEETADKCRITFKRPNWQPMSVEFTEADAKAAGLTGKQNWQKFKAAMLYARCFSKGARRIGSDLLNGCCYTPEELGADVDDAGNVKPSRVVTSTVIDAPSQPDPLLQDAPPANGNGHADDALDAPAAQDIKDRCRAMFDQIGVGVADAEAIVKRELADWTNRDMGKLRAEYAKLKAKHDKKETANA